MRATRDDVVTEAQSWVGTPFADCCGVKGAGVDCAMLLREIFCGLELVPWFDPRPYKPQWFEHQDEPLFMQWLEKCARRTESPLPGDVALMNFGKHAAHGAIVINERAMIHAYKPAGQVIMDERRSLAHRVHSFWTVFP